MVGLLVYTRDMVVIVVCFKPGNKFLKSLVNKMFTLVKVKTVAKVVIFVMSLFLFICSL